MDKPNIPWYNSYFLILMMLNRRTSCVIYKWKALYSLLSPQTSTGKHSQEQTRKNETFSETWDWTTIFSMFVTIIAIYQLIAVKVE